VSGASYAESGLAGRPELSPFFLEDLLPAVASSHRSNPTFADALSGCWRSRRAFDWTPRPGKALHRPDRDMTNAPGTLQSPSLR
jgi:hypothetical protein